jgi:elongation factor G
MALASEAIRNIAVTGHGATGKTSLVEQLLAFGGVIPKAEAVEGGKTVSDFTEEETARGISIHLSLSHLEWQERKINLLDTPGATDFVGELTAGLRAAETALVLVAADAGVQIGTIQTWRRLRQRGTPRLVFVNKMDKEHADFDGVLAALKENFQANFVPLTIPIGEGAGFKGVVDLVSQRAYLLPEAGRKAAAADIPAEAKEEAARYRQALVEAAAEGDDKLMEKFFESETLSDEEIQRGLIGGLRSGKMVPVLCGSALQASGILSLANALAAICPSPLGRLEPLAVGAAGAKAADSGLRPGKEAGQGSPQDSQEPASRPVDPQGPAACFVFKTSIDQFSGKLSFIKVVSGSIRSDTELVTARDRRKEKLNKIYTCQGKKLEDTEALVAGDVGILTKLPTAITNDTLCSPELELAFRPLALPQPVHAVAISAAAKKDEDKLNQLLQRAAEEDLTFRIAYNQETKENVISGMGELHLDIILGKIRSQAKIEVQTKTPKVAYRETIRAPGAAEYQHKKQTGGHGQYAKVALEIKPLPRGQQFNFVNAIVGGRISKGYIPGVEKGVLEGMESGILAGYPVVDLEASVVDGKEHPVDSSELAFKLAARGALREAMEKADPVLLEPVMNLTVYVDNQYLGDVLSDLSSRRGRVLGQEQAGAIQVVKAQVPQAELLRYSIDLRSMTSGTASFEVEFDHYSPISGKVAETVIAASKAEKEAEKV